MKRLVTSLLVLAVALAAVATAGAADPREERRQLTAADNTQARRGVVVRSWLGPGWTKTAPSADTDDDFTCPGYNPDFSRFTITGEAESAFKHPSGASLASGVSVFPTRTQALGDFRLGAKPQLAGCLRTFLVNMFKSDDSGATYSVTARVVPAARVGERSIAFRVVVQVKVAGRPAIPLYGDFHVFQKGRSQGFLFFMGIMKPVTGQVPLARAMAARMA